jgi:hypothetical protein
MDDMVSSLCNLNTWDRYMMAKGNGTFDQVMGAGPDIYPVLIDHLADETETAIEDEMTGRKPKVCDLVLLMLLELMHRKWQDFSIDGLFISTALPNPVFCIKWDHTTKLKVRIRFRYFLDHPEEEKK